MKITEWGKYVTTKYKKIYTIGNPNGFGLSFTTGVISNSERDIVYNEKTIKTMQTSLVINEGNSDDLFLMAMVIF